MAFLTVMVADVWVRQKMSEFICAKAFKAFFMHVWMKGTQTDGIQCA